MKKLLLLSLFFMFAVNLEAEVNQKPQKFEVVYTITYNAITLEEAADKEILIKKRFKDACKVETDVDKPSELGTFTNATFTIAEDTLLDFDSTVTIQ